MIYLDNAASSWPKPQAVIDAVVDAIKNNTANPGRSGHRLARESGQKVFIARRRLAELIGAAELERVVFTANATEALNIAIKGLVEPGDHVITTVLEHNSVLRPLRSLEKQGVTLEVLPCDRLGLIDADSVKNAFRANTRLVIVSHASNVFGTVQPIADVGQMTRDAGICLLVDAAQTIGAIPVDVQQMNIDLLAMTGHKSLLGPQGTGALYVAPGVYLKSLKEGGTGSRSELEEQPAQYPDFLESGTLNGIGLAGLAAALAFIEETGLKNIMLHEQDLLRALLVGLRAIPGVIVYGHSGMLPAVPVVSFNLKGCDPSEVGFILDRVHDAAVRPGLHCAPLAHKAMDTYPGGTVRASLSYMNTLAEIEQFLAAVRQIAADMVPDA